GYRRDKFILVHIQSPFISKRPDDRLNPARAEFMYFRLSLQAKMPEIREFSGDSQRKCRGNPASSVSKDPIVPCGAVNERLLYPRQRDRRSPPGPYRQALPIRSAPASGPAHGEAARTHG